MEEKRPGYPENQIRVDEPARNICCAVYAGPQDLTPITALGYAGPDNGMIGMSLSDYQKLMQQKTTPSSALRPDADLPEAESAICSACSARVAKRGKFCPNCGAILPWNNS